MRNGFVFDFEKESLTDLGGARAFRQTPPVQSIVCDRVVEWVGGGTQNSSRSQPSREQ